MARRRHLSRIAVMQTLFEREHRTDVDIEVVLQRNITELGEMDTEFAAILLKGVLEKEHDLWEIIALHAPGWTRERMDPIARAVLLVGAFELVYGNDAPAAVVINEAIEVAKEYCTDESGKFVNGVLNAIAHRSGQVSDLKPKT